MEQPVRLAVIGGGNMGAALVQGLLRAGHSHESLAVCEASAARREVLAAMFPRVRLAESAPHCSDAIIAVKPADVPGACRAVVSAGAHRVVSIAAGVRVSVLQRACGDGVRVARAMPNTAATVGLSATAVAFGDDCSTTDREWALALLSCIGVVVEVPEPMLDAFTGLAGSGPAYVLYLAEALQQAAIAEGFDAKVAADIVARVLVGAAALLEREPAMARELRDRVTSPNGTTAAGLSVFEQRDVRQAIVDAVHAATLRSKELGDA